MRFLLGLVFTTTLLAGEPIEVSPQSHDFGTVEGGKASDPVVFRVKNVYGKDLVFGTVNIGGKDFLDFRIGRDLCSYSILKDGGTCEVEVVFQPRLPSKKKRKPGKFKKKGLLVIPFSEMANLDKVWRKAIPLQGTALIKKAE